MKKQLLETAFSLNPPEKSVTQEFSQKRDQLAAMGSQKLAERPDLDKLVGESNRQMAEDNNRNFARFMESMFQDYDSKVMVETVLWVFRAYRSHGFQTTYWAANLNIWIELLREELSEEAFEGLYPYYNWLVVHIPIFTKLTDSVIADNE